MHEITVREMQKQLIHLMYKAKFVTEHKTGDPGKRVRKAGEGPGPVI